MRAVVVPMWALARIRRGIRATLGHTSGAGADRTQRGYDPNDPADELGADALSKIWIGVRRLHSNLGVGVWSLTIAPLEALDAQHQIVKLKLHFLFERALTGRKLDDLSIEQFTRHLRLLMKAYRRATHQRPCRSAASPFRYQKRPRPNRSPKESFHRLLPILSCW